jgi:hypothetical protein
MAIEDGKKSLSQWNQSDRRSLQGCRRFLAEDFLSPGHEVKAVYVLSAAGTMRV